MSKQKQYELIHEDADMLVVNKSLKLRTLPDRHQPDLPNLYNILQAVYGEVFVVHRLDKDTSGVICFARNAEAHRKLNQQFEEHTTVKKYWAIVSGCPIKEEDRIEIGIIPHPVKLGTMVVSTKGKQSISDYKVIEAFRHFSLLEVLILTGRTHQIRVHLAHIGHPLAVDPTYGQRESLMLSEIKKRKFNLGKWEEELPIMDRVPLHAYSLELTHPTTNERLFFEVAPPKDIMALLNQLRKWDKIDRSR